MLRTMLKSKIHRATVTQADLHYVGSVTIDADLMDAADLLEGEQVTIVDIDNGARLVTYAITGERGSGVIGINGAAAHLVHPGDLVILIAYGTMEDAEARDLSTARGVRRRRQQADRPGTRSRPRTGRRVRPDVAPVDPVLLAIDVRNTHTVVGLVSGSGDHAKVVHHWRIRTESEVTADELALTIDGLIGDDVRAADRRGRAVHGAVGAARSAADAGPVLAVGAARVDRAGVRTGIPLLVDNPKEVGADRIVNCLAAYHKYGTAAIVVDFGSSICVDVVSAKGEFLGGAIAPGVQVSSDAAAARSAALRRVELTRPRSVVGKNTVECMQAGAVFGFAALVDGLVSRIRDDVDGFAGDDVAVVATGHTAPLVLPDLHTVEHYDQHLTLDGLRLVFERNRDSQRGRLKQAR